jgi:hypothetical protein
MTHFQKNNFQNKCGPDERFDPSRTFIKSRMAGTGKRERVTWTWMGLPVMDMVLLGSKHQTHILGDIYIWVILVSLQHFFEHENYIRNKYTSSLCQTILGYIMVSTENVFHSTAFSNFELYCGVIIKKSI